MRNRTSGAAEDRLRPDQVAHTRMGARPGQQFVLGKISRKAEDGRTDSRARACAEAEARHPTESGRKR